MYLYTCNKLETSDPGDPPTLLLNYDPYMNLPFKNYLHIYSKVAQNRRKIQCRAPVLRHFENVSYVLMA